MQIDMHYYGVYVIARLAGVKRESAETIATASQYVDDAVMKDIQHNAMGSMLAPVLTAHRVIELKANRNLHDQPFVWVPFHFFPGNEGDAFTERLLCRKDSPLVNAMFEHYLGLAHRPFSLELMGIAAHVYCDTFSHYGFSGVSSRRNKVKADSIKPLNASDPTAGYLDEALDRFFRKFGSQGGLWTNIRRQFISGGAEIASGALGHGAAAILPDLPYLKWRFDYDDFPFQGQPPVRDNIETFLKACEKLHARFVRFIANNSAHADGTAGVDFQIVKDRIRDLLSYQNGKEERCANWRKAYEEGGLQVAGEPITPYEKNQKRWDKKRDDFPKLGRPEETIRQELYRFYQAANYHLHYVLRDLLPINNLLVV